MIHLLGQPQVLWGDQPLHIKRRLARVLIYYLACQKSMVGRSDLILLFWPESPNARQNLRDLLSKLRAELPDPDLIRTDRDWIGLDFNKVNSDVLIFEDLYEQLSLPFLNIENRPLPEAIYQKLLNAIKMWDVPAFMHGHSPFDRDELNEWISDKSRRLRFKLLSLMMRAAHHLMVKGDLENALSWLETVTENDDDYEFPQAIYHRLNMLYRLGRLSKAHEYGLDYIDQINTSWFAEYRLAFETLMKRIENERNQAAIHIYPPTKQGRERLIPFFGREDLISGIQMAYQRGDMVVLSGETGSGKSRLFNEFVNTLGTPNPVYLMEAIYAERNLAFHPIIELLRRTMNMNDWQKIEKFWISQLSPFMPELQGQVQHKADIYSLIDNQQRSVYEAFRQVLFYLSRRQKIIIRIENSQWLDGESVSLLAYLTHRHFFNEKAHLFFLISKDDLNAPIFDYLKNPTWASEIAWIDLPALDIDAISVIAQHLLKNPLTVQQRQQLLDATGGNFLFLIETLQLISERLDPITDKNWDQIPLSGVVQIVIRDRLSHISDIARQILGCAALVGPTFSYDYIQVMAEMQESMLVNGIDELINKEFIGVISQMHQPLQYKFNQTFLREVVLQGLSQTQKHILHKRLAKYLLTHLEEKKTADELADLGYHLGQAGLIEQAFQYWIEAAEIYMNDDVHQKAQQAYKQAYLLSQNRTFDLTEQQLFDLWIGWGDLATKMNDFESATESYRHAIEEGSNRDSPLLLGSGLSGEGFLYSMRGLPIQGLQYLERAAFHLKDGYLLEFIRNSNRKMLTYLQHFDLQAIIQEYETIAWAESQLKTDKEQLVLANLQSTLAMTYVLEGNFKAAEMVANKSIQKALEFNNPSLRIENEFALGLGYYYQGKYKRALEKFGLTSQIAESNFKWRLLLGTLVMNSRVYFALGKTYRSLENIQNGYTLSKVYQYTGMHSNLITAEGKLQILFGKYEQAISFFKRSIEVSNNKRHTSFNQIWIAWCKVLLGELGEGISQLKQIVSDLENDQMELISLESKARLGLALYLKGNVPEALRLLEEVTQQSQKYGLAGAGTAYAYVQAQEAIRKNDPELAIKMGEIILQKARQEESPWLEWHALEILITAEDIKGKTSQKWQNQKQYLYRELNQSKPQNMGFTLEPDLPPLQFLV